MPKSVVVTPGGARYALEGRVVTMDASNQVLKRGTVYVKDGQIVALTPTGAPAPPDVADVTVIKTGGTIYPGLIELHNHLSYNILQLWQVPKKFTNRDQWAGLPAYRKLISGPMNVLGRTQGYVEAIVRYVECKCLLSGVTTTQGIALFSNAGITRYYRGIVRNVEEPDDPALRAATSRIADVEATDAAKFLARLRSSSCLLLHLSEGTDSKARQHFQALQTSPSAWAITSALAGIHCAALQPADFQVLGQQGGAMIWSPLSNLLLYGQTADVKAAKAGGVRMGIGSDWSPSGSKNLLGELKVARLVSQSLGGVFTDLEIIAMATRNAANILNWDQRLGSIEVGKRADLVVVAGRTGDAYGRLLDAHETDILLVIIDGVARYGRTGMMAHFGPSIESWRVGNSQRVLNLAQASADPVVGKLSLAEARDRLTQGLHTLPKLARAVEQPPAHMARLPIDARPPHWMLLLDHSELDGAALRPHLPFGSKRTPTAPPPAAAAPTVPLSQIVVPLELDRLTAADDSTLADKLAHQPNLPKAIQEGLAARL
jgi:5-methylthioadenosine/S-adenosylhomocysteine deaminase